jgi:hypothetical protein
MMTAIKLTHSPRSDGKLHILRSPSPMGYGAPTWGAVFRLLYTYATNPGKVGQGRIKSKPGWCWSCLHCGRELVGEESKRPVACRFCKSRSLQGHETSVYYLAQPTGRDYAGGIDIAEFVADWSLWVLCITPDPRAFHAAECWARGLGSHRQAQYSGCSQRYALLALEALGDAYNERRVADTMSACVQEVGVCV